MGRFYYDNDGDIYEMVHKGHYRLLSEDEDVPGGPSVEQVRELRARLKELLQLTATLKLKPLLSHEDMYRVEWGFVRTHKCVRVVDCPYEKCKASAGKLCRNDLGAPVAWTHAVRRQAWAWREKKLRRSV